MRGEEGPALRKATRFREVCCGSALFVSLYAGLQKCGAHVGWSEEWLLLLGR